MTSLPYKYGCPLFNFQIQERNINPFTALTVDTDAMQEVKRGAKEASRQHLLDRDPGSTISTPTDWEEVTKLVKAKQTAVSTIMRPPKRKVKQAEKAGQKKGKNKVSLKKVASKPGVRQVTTTMVRTLQDRTNINSVTKEPTIHLCGCRHGDLDALKRFNKNEAMYYIRPNRFLEGMGCRDCEKVVLDMKPVAPNQKSVVFYCDQGIKGFDAPEDDPMKLELVCNLVLCAQCEALRRISFESATIGRGGGRRNRSRHLLGK
jgi:hypothetical protein